MKTKGLLSSLMNPGQPPLTGLLADPPKKPLPGLLREAGVLRPRTDLAARNKAIGGLPELVVYAEPRPLRADEQFLVQMQQHLAPLSRMGEAAAEPVVVGTAASVENGLELLGPILKRLGIRSAAELALALQGRQPMSPFGAGVRQVVRSGSFLPR